MKQYLLDTNICIFFLQNKYDIVEKLERVGRKNCYISEITVAELLYGAACSANPEKHLAETRTFIDKFEILHIYPVLFAFAQIKATLRKQGLPIDDFDLLIGTTAVVNGLIMVTENQKHLSRIPQIETENWVVRK
ncbi:PIN domain-containing protein [Parabacteroides sp.]